MTLCALFLFAIWAQGAGPDAFSSVLSDGKGAMLLLLLTITFVGDIQRMSK